MNIPHRMPLGTRSFLACVISGILLACSFPRPEVWPLVLVGLAPLIVVAGGRNGREAWWCGFLSGLAYFGVLLYWIVPVLTFYGGLALPVAFPIFLLLIAYLSLYPALFALCVNLAQGWGARAGGIVWIVLGAAVYTGLEYFRGFFLTGFPWEPLGAAFAPSRVFVQSADVFGAAGLTFFIVLVNMSLAAGFLAWRQRRPKGLIAPLVLIAAVIGSLAMYGHFRYTLVEEAVARAETRDVVVVQGSVEQTRKWDPDHRVSILLTYRDLTLAAAGRKPWMIVWPETATPFFYHMDDAATQWLSDVVRRSGTPLFFGSPAFEEEGGKTKYYNRVYLLDGQGTMLGHYDKVHLVPYGEYVPLQDFFPFITKLTGAVGNYFPGETDKVVTLDGEKIGVLICFESIFSGLAREAVDAGAHYLAIVTNDAWFGRSSAPEQHFAQAVLRAVETRRSVIRAANTGLSGFILPSGRVTASLGLFERDILPGRAPRMDMVSPYTKWGDVLPRVCLGITAFFLAAAAYRRKRHAR